MGRRSTAKAKTQRQKDAERKRLEEARVYFRSQHTLPPEDRLSIHATARKYNVSYYTLRSRLEGLHQDAHRAHESQQRLSTIQEDVLVEWLTQLSNQGVPVSKKVMRNKVQVITGGRLKPGKNWMDRFRRRHPELKFGKPSGLDPKRAQCFNRKTVTDHFALLQKVLNDLDIPWENVWNMDEKGCQRGGGRKQSPEKFFIPRNRRPAYRNRSGNLELVTIIECVSALGDSIQPGFVFPGKEYHRGWFEVDPDICISTSPNGWTDEHLGALWFEKCFIPQATARNTSGKPILLIFDGHGSHLTEEIHQLALSNNIHLFCLPAHTTHRLQPLDVGIFGPLGNAFMQRCDDVLYQTGKEIPIENFVKEYMEARTEAFKSETIKKAFKNSGIHPFNPEIFTDEDYAPSIVSSTNAHMPPSYPQAAIGFVPYTPLPDDVQSISSEDEDSSDDDDPPEPSDDDEDFDAMDPNDTPTDTEETIPSEPSGVAGESTTSSISNPDISQSSQNDVGLSESPPTQMEPGSVPQIDDTLPDSATHTTPATEPGIIENRHQRRRPRIRFQPYMSTKEKFEAAMAELEKVYDENDDLEKKLDAFETHCAMARHENQHLKQLLNAKEKGGGRRATVGLESRCVTAGDGLIAFDTQMAAQKEKKRKKAEAKANRERLSAEKRAEKAARGPTEVFTGGLAGKNKDALEEIVTALVIPLTAGKRYTKSDLIDLIKKHLEDHPELKENPRFSRLFGGRGQRQRDCDPSTSDLADKENQAVSSQPLAQSPIAGPSHTPTRPDEPSTWPVPSTSTSRNFGTPLYYPFSASNNVSYYHPPNIYPHEHLPLVPSGYSNYYSYHLPNPS